MSDQVAIFFDNNGTIKGISQTDNILTSGIKRSSGSVTIEAGGANSILLKANNSTLVQIQGSTNEVLIDGTFRINNFIDFTVNSPDVITGNQDNYILPNSSFVRLSSDASRTITGFANGEDGRHLMIINIGGSEIILANQNVSSSDENRIITGTGGNVTLDSDDVAILIYDSVSLRWRLLV